MAGVFNERVLDILEWNSILEELRKRCDTVPGKDLVSELEPLSYDAIKNQIQKIAEIKELISQGEIMDFSGAADIAPCLDLAGKGGTLKLDDLFQLRNFIIASKRLKDFLHHNRERLQSLSGERDGMSYLKEIGSRIIPSITDEGEINISQFPELKRIKDEIFRTRQETEKKLMSLIYSPAMERILQEKVFTTRNERYCLLVKSSMKNSISGASLDVSSSGATLFIEPEEIRGSNNRLLSLMLEVQIEIARILKELSGAVAAHSDELRANLSIIAYLDLLNSGAKFSISVKGSGAVISPDPVIRLYSARHPLLYLMIPDRVVPNDIFLGENYNCLLISGANTGGKTVLLKTIGLCVLLAMHGFHIPAGADSAVGIFTDIMADIGDDQSIAQSLSSYSGQIVILKEMIEKARETSLVLIDEIVVGTNPRQGAALAQGLLENMVSSGAKIVVTTHYTELKELASVDPRFQNASVSFDMNTLAPTYHLSIGTPGVSYALEIAKIYGIGEDVLSRARKLLDEKEMSIEALVEKMQKHEQEIREERSRLSRLSEDLERERGSLAEEQKKLNRLAEEIKNEKGILFLEEIKDYRNQVRERIRNLQNSDIKTSGEIIDDLRDVEKTIKDKLLDDAKNRYAHRYIPFDPGHVKTGDKAFIISIEREGIIESIDINNESALLLLGNSIKTRFRFKDLLMLAEDRPEPRPAPKGKKKKSSGGDGYEGAQSLTIQTQYNTVDLRGMRVDEALDKMERDFDHMVRSGIRTAIVIHGHGTGALKEAVRKNLRFSSYAVSFRPGGYQEGGDGVSVVFLRD